MPIYEINSIGDPSSCLLKINNHNVRSLVDSGAEVSVLSRKFYLSLKNRPPLKQSNSILAATNQNLLQVDGTVNLQFKIGKDVLEHTFHVTPDTSRNVILGRDFLIMHGVRIYYDLGCLKIKSSYVPLDQDCHITSIIRTQSDIVLKPQTNTVCMSRVKMPDKKKKSSKLYQVCSIDKGVLSQEPGLALNDAIIKFNRSSKFPVLITNSSNKTFKLKRGTVIGKIEPIKEQNLQGIHEIIKNPQHLDNIKMEDIHVPPEFKGMVHELVNQHSHLFANSDTDLGHTNTVEMKIDTGDHPPIRLKPYRTPLNNRSLVSDAVDNMLNADIVEPSQSPWSFPVVIVDKKDGSKRFCVDFRKLNAVTKPFYYPLERVDDLLASLNSAKYFTSLDMKSGYWQVPIHPADREKTCFTTFRGNYQFKVMPFGLINAPSVFSQLMATVLQGLGHFAVAYLDDILIFSQDAQTHKQNILTVLQRLADHNLKLKLSKCFFFQSETKYLGFVINDKGIKPDPDKVQVIRSMQEPSSTRQVRGFIGLCSYYRRFIPNFSEIAKPLINLTKKYSKFEWTKECQTAFDFLKNSLSTIPVLSYPDPKKPYILYTDASDTCVGAVLCQKCDPDESTLPGVKNENPIHYLSHKLSPTQVKWPTIVKEAYAIKFATDKLDHYLHNAEFVIKTDHKPLKYLLSSPMQNKKVQLWALDISSYNCKIEYIEGKKNTCGDFLSRLPGHENWETEEICPDIDPRSFEINVINSNKLDPKDFPNTDPPPEKQNDPQKLIPTGLNMSQEQAKDKEIIKVITQLRDKTASKSTQRKFLIIDNVLYFVSDPETNPVIRLVIPEHLKGAVAKQYHDNTGHLGIDRTFDLIKQKYFWKGLYLDIVDYVSSCVPCQTRNLTKIKPPLQETVIPGSCFSSLAVDTCGPYPRSLSGNKYIVTFVDLFSGWPEAFCVPDKSAETMAQLLIDEILPRYGAPRNLISDNGSEWGAAFKNVLEEMNIKHIKTSFYHPAGNSRCERMHRQMHDSISKLLQDNLSTWDLHLNQVLGAIRMSISESSKFSPFYLLYKQDPILPLDNILRPRRRYMGEDPHQMALEQQHKAYTMAHRNMVKARKRQAKYANRNTKRVEFRLGDPVYLKNHQRKSKLQSKWKPFYRIIEIKSPVTFIVKNQLDGTTTKTHAEHIRLANIDEWEIPKRTNARPMRRANYVVPPDSESGSSSSESDSEDDIPLATLIKRKKKENENSDSESDIPLMQLAKQLRERENPPSSSDSATSSSYETDNDENTHSVHDIDLNIDKQSCISTESTKVRNLLQAVIGML